MKTDTIQRLTALGMMCSVDLPIIPTDAMDLCLTSANQLAELQAELRTIARTADTLRTSCIDAQNQLHGVSGTAPGRRTIHDIELTLETMRDEILQSLERLE